MVRCKNSFRSQLYVFLFFGLTLVLFFFSSCPVKKQSDEDEEKKSSPSADNIKESFYALFSKALDNLEFPEYISEKLLNEYARNSVFINDLVTILKGDPHLWLLVDKRNSVGTDYEPHDLVSLKSESYRFVSRHELRQAAFDSLEEMAQAAADEGLTLVVLSAFRSYFYQSRLYTNYVIMDGQTEADRVSARPGFSQHQLGLAVDFNHLDNSLADTKEGMWLEKNASRFGWSNSYPDGYERLTGYSWESWHYRYVGKNLAKFIDDYFNGVQQYALLFINELTKIGLPEYWQLVNINLF